MTKITPLREICQLAQTDILQSHITKQGNMYIPKVLGGVTTTSKEFEDCIKIFIRPDGTEWKKYKYIGSNYAQGHFVDDSIKTIGLALEYYPDFLCWIAKLCKKEDELKN